MKWNLCFYSLLTNSIILITAQSISAQPIPYKSVNSNADDYAIAFRTLKTKTELWITSSRGQESELHRSKKILIATVNAKGIGEFTEAPQPLNQPSNLSKNSQVQLNGCPVFSQCDGNYGIMVSNRLMSNGKSTGNDLYEIQCSPSGEWAVNRLDSVNSDYWDDTPTLSTDGNFLYFSSDRNSPGRRLTDIFVSTKTSSGWSTPQALDGINSTEYSEQTPFVNGDGYLYYATNRSGDYDIWRVELDKSSGKPIGIPKPFDMKGVNKVGSDEGHPLFSPGGEWFLFTSNKTDSYQTKDFDIYQNHMFQPADTLQITVLLRTKRATVGGEYEDITEPQSTSVYAVDGTLKKTTQNSDNLGIASFIIPRAITQEPAFDQRFRSVVVSAKEKNPEKQISSKDTLLFDRSCHARLNHTLIIWDTATYFTTGCRQDFPIVNVQFFVSAYWCPTTLKYQNFTLCGSIFPNPECKIVETIKPELPCKNNDLYHYQLNYTEPTVEVTRPYGLCADLNEAKQHGAEYAQKVDSAVSKFIENMEIALKQPCVQRAIQSHKPITVEVVGWTDPRSIDNRCIYTGRDINLKTSFVKLQNIESKQYISNGLLSNGTPFSKSGAGGNQMLSDLRAYYTASMLDTLWQLNLPEYNALRHRKGAINVVAIGKAISLEHSASYGQQRSVNVRIIAEDDNLKTISGKIPLPSSTTVICGTNCFDNQIISFTSDSTNKPKKDTIDLPKPKIIGKPIQSTEIREESSHCYSILFHTFPSEEEAIGLQTEIISKKFNNIRVIPFIELSGRKFYRVLTGCYDSNQTAEQIERELPPLLQSLTVKCTTMIIQE
ncbi:MAG: PD40 domain-containing protein [Bacteroidetes bacterium]|nr:PD40 domain-containing protein [Bacteroidota bacterium]